MIFRPHSNSRAGYTLIEVFEGIAAIVLGAWLADRFSSHFHGVWHKIIYWSVATVGSGIIFVIFLYGFGYLVHYSRRHKT